VSKTYRRHFAKVRPYELKLNLKILYEPIYFEASGQKGRENWIW